MPLAMPSTVYVEGGGFRAGWQKHTKETNLWKNTALLGYENVLRKD